MRLSTTRSGQYLEGERVRAIGIMSFLLRFLEIKNNLKYNKLIGNNSTELIFLNTYYINICVFVSLNLIFFILFYTIRFTLFVRFALLMLLNYAMYT